MNTTASPSSRSFSSAADRDLVVSACNGQEGGFEELVRRYQRPISAYVYRMVGDYESALDLTQEIFIKIYGSLSRTGPSLSFRPGSTKSLTTQRSTTCAGTQDANDR